MCFIILVYISDFMSEGKNYTTGSKTVRYIVIINAKKKKKCPPDI